MIRVTIEGVPPREWWYPSKLGQSQFADHDGMFVDTQAAFAWVHERMVDFAKYVPAVIGLDVLFRVYEGLRVGTAPRTRDTPRGTLLIGCMFRMVADARGLRWRRTQDDGPTPPEAVRKIQQPVKVRKPVTGAVGYDDKTGEVTKPAAGQVDLPGE